MLIKGGSSVSDRLLALLNTDTYDGYPQSVTARPAISDERHGGSLAAVFQHGVLRLGSPGSLFDKYARILRPRPSASDRGPISAEEPAGRERLRAREQHGGCGGRAHARKQSVAEH
ncbi:hypothetical protein ALC56_11121 [Trachymyrmex septentrionalis]|uniref:Uncharacterized protein n=1 Tax=Trachymyrmex septentrionalis TaxID=34720 RepID=A0A195F2E4_9HYME|nr:hypothetical protein ALC56_11121 [Trachymyrmex septentrionalis]